MAQVEPGPCFMDPGKLGPGFVAVSVQALAQRAIAPGRAGASLPGMELTCGTLPCLAAMDAVKWSLPQMDVKGSACAACSWCQAVDDSHQARRPRVVVLEFAAVCLDTL